MIPSLKIFFDPIKNKFICQTLDEIEIQENCK